MTTDLTTRTAEQRLSLILDVCERVVFALLFASFCIRFGRQVEAYPHYIIIMAQEALVIALVLFRPWGSLFELRAYPIAIAFIGTMLGLFLYPIGVRPEYVSLGGAIMLVGLFFSVSGKLALNRRFGFLVANRGAQTRGPYAIVRHPIYTGYTVSSIGFLITNPAVWNVAVVSLMLLFQVLRIFEEEKFLSLDPVYRAYKERVRYRLLPFVF